MALQLSARVEYYPVKTETCALELFAEVYLTLRRAVGLSQGCTWSWWWCSSSGPNARDMASRWEQRCLLSNPIPDPVWFRRFYICKLRYETANI